MELYCLVCWTVYLIKRMFNDQRSAQCNSMTCLLDGLINQMSIQ